MTGLALGATSSAGTRRKRRDHRNGHIEIRHAGSCAANRGRGCTCQPGFRGSVTVKGRRFGPRTFKTRSEAQAFIDAAWRGETVDTPEAITFGFLLARFVEDAAAGKRVGRGRAIAPATAANYERHVRNHLLRVVDPRTGRLFVEESIARFDDAMALRLTHALTETAGPSSVRTAVAVYRAAWAYGRRIGLVEGAVPNPGVVPPPSPPRIRIVEDARIPALLAAARRDDERHGRSLVHPFVWVLLQTGLRFQEAAGLRWSDVDLEPEGRLRVRRETTKSDAGVRVVDFLEDTRAVLVEHRRCLDMTADGPVFAGPDGEPLRRGGLMRAALSRIAKEAGLPGLSSHDLRHTHGTNLARVGMPPAVAARRLGHGDGGVLFLQRYSHPDAQDEAGYLRPLDV